VRSAQPDLLAGREDELAADWGAAAGKASRNFQQHRDRRLVVRAQDCVTPIREIDVATLDLYGVGEWHGVEMCAEHDRARAIGTGQAREQVAALGAGLGGSVVLEDVEADRFQLGLDRPRDLELTASGALNLTKADEGLGEPRLLGLRSRPHC
jgi:hypothetical protein